MVPRSLLFPLMLICVSQLAQCLYAETGDTRLQGFWFGDGPHPMNRFVLLVRDGRFIVITPLGVSTSTYTTIDKPSLDEIDIERFDGDRQLGVYEISGTKLRLKLSEPTRPRPTLDDVQFPNGKPHWHTTFDRRPKSEGLEVLKKHLDAIPAPRTPPNNPLQQSGNQNGDSFRPATQLPVQ